MNKTYYCLGNGERGCDGCAAEKNWQSINELPNEYRIRLQSNQNFVRVDDTECILRGRPYYKTTAPIEPVKQEPVAKVAALFVQDNGCYMNLKHVDAWPLQRDARKYSGNLPVVAHPPCQLWGSFAAVNYARWGGEHNKPGNDEGYFEAALNSVKRFGGVLEHPAKSRAFSHYGICKPTGVGWTQSKDGGWVCEVWQSAYGHRANKATWLYYFGSVRPFELKWDRPTGSHQIGFYDQRGKENNKPTLGKKEANATPIEFRDELIRLALYAAPVRTKDLTDEFLVGATEVE